jgi:hypothetical protein
MDEGGNHDDFISSDLCVAFRKTIRTEMKADNDKIIYTIRIIGTMTALFLSVVQLAIRIFMG